MGNLSEFLRYLEEQWENASIYVWGGQGENYEVISESWIRRMETSEKNANRAITLWKKRVAEGKGNVLRAYDCSGLIMYYLQNMKGIYSYDMASNTLKGKCRQIGKGDLRPGDFVFRVYASGASKGRAYHVGVVVDEQKNVIEAKGRDDGVVKRHIDVQQEYWNYFGRPECFKAEIEGQSTQPQWPGSWVLSRLLKRISPIMRGEDVRHAQEALIVRGYSCGNRGADGQYGDESKKAAERFQQENGLSADGIIGQDTCEKLGGTWQEGTGAQLGEWKLSRLLKRVSPIMQGEDVRHAQEALIARGYSCGNRGADGQYGDESKKAAQRFQQENRLSADGIIGRDTCEALGGEWISQQGGGWELSRLLKRVSPLMQGEDVRRAQEALIARGYSCGSNGADGQYGRETENAVERFQQENGLTVDGIIGRNTCKTLGGNWRG